MSFPSVNPRPLSDQVVVITGASSGIGRATALRLARAGARVVASARDSAALDALVAEIRSAGGAAVAVTADVTDDGAVNALAQAAITAYGRIDTWVNNAGVSAYGTVEQLTVADMERVVDVDLLGTMRGTKAALRHLRTSGGVIVNVASGLGKRSVPLQAPYCAAKAGVIAFDESLRVELRHDRVPVAIVDVLPSSINTPFFRHARSRMGVSPRPVVPTYDPATVAAAIAAVAERPKRTVYVGGAARTLDVLQRISPALTDQLVLLTAFRGQRSRRASDATDNFDAPAAPRAETRGEWTALRRSVYTQVTTKVRSGR